MLPASKKAGDTVTITGENFKKVRRVTFTANGKTTDAASYVVKTDKTIDAVLPAGVQTGNVIVTNSKGASDGFSYTAGA